MADQKEECNKCTHYGLYQMIMSGKPFGYFGDIPCSRCCNLKRTHSEFTPASLAVPRTSWDALKTEK